MALSSGRERQQRSADVREDQGRAEWGPLRRDYFCYRGIWTICYLFRSHHGGAGQLLSNIIVT